MVTKYKDLAAQHSFKAISATTHGDYIHHNQLAAFYRRLAAIV